MCRSSAIIQMFLMLTLAACQLSEYSVHDSASQPALQADSDTVRGGIADSASAP